MRAITALPLAVVLLLATPAAAQPPDDELHFAWLPRKAEPAAPPAPEKVEAPAPAAACEPAPRPSLAKTPKQRQKAWYARAWSAVVSVVR
jgi:hypothetical protein